FTFIATPFMMLDTLSVGIVQLGIGFAALGFSILGALITIPIYKHLLKFTKQVTRILIVFFNRRIISIW
ncbi:MAG: hypothetical protein ACRC41_16785, partial [Sarcina sp.]